MLSVDFTPALLCPSHCRPGPEGEGVGMDDEEAGFWATYRAQEREAAEKEAKKERNFAAEWSTAFVHLR